jgi:hypothetical protein
MASRLPLLGELRASRGARAARPATLALSGDVCVVGYEDGAVAAWRARDVVSAARDRTNRGCHLGVLVAGVGGGRFER